MNESSKNGCAVNMCACVCVCVEASQSEKTYVVFVAGSLLSFFLGVCCAVKSKVDVDFCVLHILF